MKSLTLFILALPSIVLGQNAFCKNEFAQNPKNCAKFDFNNVVPDDQKCGKSLKKQQKMINGIKQTNCTTFYDISAMSSETIDEHTTNMAQLITNVFENGNTKMGYAAANDIKDCRGYTSGYIGFTTGTNDAYQVIKSYGERKHINPFKRYLKELKKLTHYDFDNPQRADTSNLQGFSDVWSKTACSDPLFVRTQLDIGHAMYLKPALKYCASVGIKSNLGKAIFYDTIVQHGWQYVEPKINLPRLLQLTGDRQEDESEKEYLTRFLTIRRQLACCYPGAVWQESSDRMSDLQKLVDDWERNKDLKKPVHLETFDVTVTGNEPIAYDTAGCKSVPSAQPFKTLPPAIDQPIPQCQDEDDS